MFKFVLRNILFDASFSLILILIIIIIIFFSFDVFNHVSHIAYTRWTNDYEYNVLSLLNLPYSSKSYLLLLL